MTFSTWTADQFSQYGTRGIPTTVRDVTYVLDEILDNETEPPIPEHTTDTAGYTGIAFAQFELLGLRFSPRISDLGDHRLFRPDRQKRHPRLAALLRGRILGQLDKGEALHGLREFLLFANKGTLREKQEEEPGTRLAA